jgi:hypothetical protein
MLGDMVDDAALVAGLGGLRSELDHIDAQLHAADRIAVDVPHRTRYLRLSHALARRIVAAHRAWADDVERELGGPGAAPRPAPEPGPALPPPRRKVFRAGFVD